MRRRLFGLVALAAIGLPSAATSGPAYQPSSAHGAGLITGGRVVVFNAEELGNSSTLPCPKTGCIRYAGQLTIHTEDGTLRAIVTCVANSFHEAFMGLRWLDERPYLGKYAAAYARPSDPAGGGNRFALISGQFDCRNENMRDALRRFSQPLSGVIHTTNVCEKCV